MINDVRGCSERTSKSLLIDGGSGIGRNGIERIVERDETLKLRVEDLAGINPSDPVEDFEDPFGIGRLLGSEIENGGDYAIAADSGIPADEFVQTNGERFHDRKPPEKTVPRVSLLIDSIHPGSSTVRCAAERTAPKEQTFEREIASCTMKPNPTVTEETR